MPNKLSGMPDFNDSKLGSGKEMVDIATSENKALDFSNARR